MFSGDLMLCLRCRVAIRATNGAHLASSGHLCLLESEKNNLAACCIVMRMLCAGRTQGSLHDISGADAVSAASCSLHRFSRCCNCTPHAPCITSIDNALKWNANHASADTVRIIRIPPAAPSIACTSVCKSPFSTTQKPSFEMRRT
jgi:hypothetical protein